MKKGFSYVVEDEKIREYMKMPTADKLKWLEEAIIFNQAVLTDKEKEFQKKLMEGRI